MERVTILWMCLLLLPATGCGYIAPSDYDYSAGVARIGDSYYVYAPLCEDEKVAEITVYNHEAALDDEAYDPDSTVHDYWKVRGPLDEPIVRGWIEIGDDAAFETVYVSAGANMPFPEIVGVRIEGSAGSGWYSVSQTFPTDQVPEYPAGSDPKDVDYGYGFGSDDFRTLSAEEISEHSMCAREYAA